MTIQIMRNSNLFKFEFTERFPYIFDSLQHRIDCIHVGVHTHWFPTSFHLYLGVHNYFLQTIVLCSLQHALIVLINYFEFLSELFK